MHAERPGAWMRAEIREQPSVAEALTTSLEVAIAEVSGAIRAARPAFVQFIGRGTSAHAALYGSYLFETLVGWPTGILAPSVVTRYAAAQSRSQALVLAISQSGASPDIVEAAEAARRDGAFTVSLTNDAASPLARATHHHLDIGAGVERAVAATKTYVAECVVLYLLADALRPTGAAGSGGLVASLEQALTGEWPAQLAAELATAQRMIFTARGFDLATAREAALKITETTGRTALAFSAAELLHGPIALADESTPLVAIGAGVDAAVKAARHRAAPVVELQAAPTADWSLPSSSLREELAPIANIVPLQQLAYHLALGDGLDPDRPQGLTKVTRTR